MHFVSISLLSWVAEEDEPWKITREGTQEMDIVEAAWGDRQQQQQQRAAAAWSSWRRSVHHKLQSGIQAGATTTDAGRTLHRLERCVFFHFFPCACGCCRLGCSSHSNCLSSILGQKFSFSLSDFSCLVRSVCRMMRGASCCISFLLRTSNIHVFFLMDRQGELCELWRV